jgi:hypothetical protein
MLIFIYGYKMSHEELKEYMAKQHSAHTQGINNYLKRRYGQDLELLTIDNNSVLLGYKIRLYPTQSLQRFTHDHDIRDLNINKPPNMYYYDDDVSDSSSSDIDD